MSHMHKLVNSGRSYQSNMLNGILEAISGKQYDSPSYELIATHRSSKGEFEERHYKGGDFWVCNKKVITGNDGDDGMFGKLFRYITGDNQGANKISMTVPVSMNMTKKGSDNSFRKEMCFYLEGSYQSNPPQPTGKDVYLIQRPSMTVYTRRVGGYMKNEDWFAEASIIDKMVAEKGFKVDQEYFFANAYNSPVKFWNRRNEVWRVKLEDEAK